MIRNRESILKAIEECDRLGRDGFLEHYGYGRARNYFLVHEGRQYDSKAIAGVAYGYENPTEGPMTAEDFSGGAATVQDWLEELGFEVRVASETAVASKTYILTWNPTKWSWDDFDNIVGRSASGEVVVEQWSTGNNQSIQPGDRVFLLRQAIDRGIIGAGYTTSEVYLGPHWDRSDKQSRYVHVDWETILRVQDVLTNEALDHANLGVNWNRIQASGISVPADSVEILEQLWRDHLAALDRSVDRLPNEVVAQARYIEGAVRTVSVNAYERNPAARQACIDHWGHECGVCGFSFGAVFGDLGDGFIHVHHLRDLASIGEEYEVDPVADLLPVCPNCHAMLHRQTPAMSIEALRGVMSAVREASP